MNVTAAPAGRAHTAKLGLLAAVIVCLGAGLAGFYLNLWQPTVTDASLANKTRAGASKSSATGAEWGLALPPKGSVGSKAEWVVSDELLYSLWEVSPPRPVKQRDAPLTPLVWRIVGTTTVGTASNLLILFADSNMPVAIAVGALLPGGEKILAVDQDYVTLLVQGKQLYLPVGR
jgi:hypothetical protein